ncbi:MAG: dienelactone hydrolase family protein, partial [Gemmatimonadetes bacterium]|nr:dienelactone hydrolase family protein [Gemmatimonadota bacterium]
MIVRMRIRPLLAACVASLAGCATAMPASQSGPMLDALFAPPTAVEIAEVKAEWSRRDTGAHGYRVEHTRHDGRTGRTLVVSHTVGGVRHFGAIRVPDGAAGRRLPVLVINHGGEGGATGYAFFHSGPVARGWVQVVPSFRSEPLRLTPFRRYRSEGDPSPWDRDVDDAMALLSSTLAHVPEADSARVAVLGRSRGGGVALLMAARDPRVKAVVDLYGPTDFFLPQVRKLAQRAVGTRVPRLPGAGYLADSVLFALRDGRTTVPRARRELLRRSVVYFADRLPPVQAHHGSDDRKVHVAHADRLDAVLRAQGRDSTQWKYYRYRDGGHGVRHLRG